MPKLLLKDFAFVIHRSRGISLLGALVLMFACESKQPVEPSLTTEKPAATKPAPMFIELAPPAAPDFQHYSGATGRWHMPEIFGSGIALIDYDSDGDLDVFFVQSSDDLQQGDDAQNELYPLPDGQRPGHYLYANQLIPTGKLTFTDVTQEAGLAETSYGMGVASGDYDNDGDIDLYVTNVGPNSLYRNSGGVFEKVDGEANDSRWSTSASFCDVNGDQLLDLYVSNYLYFSRSEQTDCRDALGMQDYCGPNAFPGAPDTLFINTGNGFEDQSKKWGVDTAAYAGLGVVCRDLNLDGLSDLYVANDSDPNLLWINRNQQSMEEQGQLSGAAINANGTSEGSMGIAVGDYDHDGDDDLFLTHWNNETNTLYRNDTKVGFIDLTNRANLAAPSMSHTGFGTQWLDIDNDSDLDLYVANGAVQRYVDSDGQTNDDYGQPNQIFLSDGKGRFVDATNEGGDATRYELTGRGVAFGDLDNDGDTDLVVSSKDAKAKVFLNVRGQLNNWLGVELKGRASFPHATQAVITLGLNSERTLRRVVASDGSYLSASDTRALFGLGDSDSPQTIEVVWPSGEVERFSGLEVGRYHLVVEGSGL